MREMVGEAKVRHNGTIGFNSVVRRYLYYSGIVCDESYLCVEKIDSDGKVYGYFANEKESTNCRKVICAGFDWIVYLSKRIIKQWNKVFGVHYYKPCYRVKYKLIFGDDGKVNIEMEPLLIEEVVRNVGH